ncbi:iron complex transport system substrate-binding protein [Paenibacillus phyllosphaerae]|uniref:Iron complex transport system substrate-binding protein n=1 Tax=Paenibacillus phyllosphaerae TaxID=274593 RepID=A0A7W5ATJ0_9BACL|nr:iron-siderophore ABC transporter substrate-binding protein [Paenibacillus phyllosphaerae]MBB3108498.1 iron complex transport system substrate-binding protein [Paenibacillus phyllosphaerae]
MNAKRKNALKMLLLSAVVAIPLAACGSNSNNSTADSNAAATNNATTNNAAANNSAATQEATTQYPITIKHAFGETVIESKPERVATIQWANHDVALALGVVPVGFSEGNYGVTDGSGMLPWTKEKLAELGVDKPNLFKDTDGLDFEAISDADPDVILASYSGITQEDYDTLSKIAPVVAYRTAPWITSWREQILDNATGMGMQAEGEQLVKDTEALIETAANKHPEIKGKKVAFVSLSPSDLSKIYVYTPADPRGGFLLELGMEFPSSLQEKVTDDKAFYIELSSENADALNDADLLVLYGDEAFLKTLQADPLMGKVPAIQKGAVALIGDNTPLAASGTPSPLSIAYTIDEYLGKVAEAAGKANE